MWAIYFAWIVAVFDVYIGPFHFPAVWSSDFRHKLYVPASVQLLLLFNYIHYWNFSLCRVLGPLPSALCRALGNSIFTECYTRQKYETRQTDTLPSVVEKRSVKQQNSANRALRSATFGKRGSLPNVPHGKKVIFAKLHGFGCRGCIRPQMKMVQKSKLFVLRRRTVSMLKTFTFRPY